MESLATSSDALILPGGAQIEFRGDERIRASALRAFVGTTPADAEVDALPLPTGPVWLRLGVRLLRWYRIGWLIRRANCCVFEPSCSRYAELAWRQDGLCIGTRKTLGRLCRCRPGAGGLDLP